MSNNISNLELIDGEENGNSDFYKESNLGKREGNKDFGGIIYNIENADRLIHMKYNEHISKSIMLENEPTNATSALDMKALSVKNIFFMVHLAMGGFCRVGSSSRRLAKYHPALKESLYSNKTPLTYLIYLMILYRYYHPFAILSYF